MKALQFRHEKEKGLHYSRRLPSFFCVGTQKSASSTLHSVLRGHPQIYLPKIKETKFFVLDKKYSRGLKFYLAEYFSQWHHELIAGEVDPDYMYFPWVPQRMREKLGDGCKLIFILRNPIDRAYSHYNMLVSRGQETLSFQEAIEIEKQRLKQDFWSRLYYSYVDRGFYAQQIERFQHYFPIENMLFLIFEEFVMDQRSSLERVCDFLGITADFLPEKVGARVGAARAPRMPLVQNLLFSRTLMKIARMVNPHEKSRRKISGWLYQMNSRRWQYPTLPSAIRRELLGRYLQDIEALELMINRDLSLWKNEESEAAPRRSVQ